MLSSFRSRLVLSNLILTLVGLLVLGAVFTQLLAQRNKDIKVSDLTAESQLVAQQIENLYQHQGTPADLQNLVDESSRSLKVGVRVVDPRGRPSFTSNGHTPYSSGTWHPLDVEALRNAENSKKELASKVVIQSPIRGRVQRNGGAVQIVANTSDVQPGIGALGNVILIVVGTALVIWLLIGLYFTFSVSRPLLRITAATRRMARGDYNVRVPARGTGEIARLATSFNTMARQIQQSDQVLKDFVANVSHDLRTPLTMIAGFSEAMLDGTAQNGEVEESAEVIHDEALKMQRMVEDLLQLTRLESGLLKFRLAPVPVREFVQSVVDRTARAHSGQPAAEIANQVPEVIPDIQIDREQLERALRNLLDNALQYTPATGQVTVGAEAIGRGWVEISVSDTGPGIPQKDVARIFERFYRTDKARERESGHSGLGLSIVRQIVEAHGGKVSVESVEGRGTTFRFTAPQSSAPEPQPATAAASQARPTESGPA
jgi:signal transduction histidine kinase